MTRSTLGQALDSYDVSDSDVSLTLPARSRIDARPTYDVTDTLAEFRAHHADLTPVDLLLSGAAAIDHHEVDQVALLSVVLFDHQTCLTPIELPDGRTVASLHSHVAHWRFQSAGFVAAESLAAGRFTRGRTPLHT